ncbi:MAG: DUF1569 domain-containing protein [Phycisphaerales bacterium]
MATFTFEALDTARKPQTGTVEAASTDEAIDRIKQLGFFPTAVRKQKFEDSTMTQIDTSIPKRRPLRFETIAQALAEAERIAAAERAGSLNRLGNWSVGQTFGHLATWATLAFDGTPLKPPWFIRLILKLQKNKYLNKGLPAGVKIPKVPGGTLGTEPLSTDDGLARLKAAFSRIDREAPTKPNVIFGPLCHDEWKRLQLRHAELHLSFLDPG